MMGGPLPPMPGQPMGQQHFQQPQQPQQPSNQQAQGQGAPSSSQHEPSPPSSKAQSKGLPSVLARLASHNNAPLPQGKPAEPPSPVEAAANATAEPEALAKKLKEMEQTVAA